MTCSPELNFREFVEKFKEIDNSKWGEYMLSKDPLYGKMIKNLRTEIVTDSINYAKEEFEKLNN